MAGEVINIICKANKPAGRDQLDSCLGDFLRRVFTVTALHCAKRIAAFLYLYLFVFLEIILLFFSLESIYMRP